MTEVSEGFADRIKTLVDLAGGQRALARKVGVRDGTIIAWLAGSHPFDQTLRKLSTSLGIDREWLITGQGTPPTNIQPSREDAGTESARVREEMETYLPHERMPVSPDVIAVIAECLSSAQIATTINRILTAPELPTEDRTMAVEILHETMGRRLKEQRKLRRGRN